MTTSGRICFLAIHNLDFPSFSEIVTNSEVLILLISALSTLARDVQWVKATPTNTPKAPPPKAMEIRMMSRICGMDRNTSISHDTKLSRYLLKLDRKARATAMMLLKTEAKNPI